MSGNIIDITDGTFKQVIENTYLVLVDFWAEWCGPCRMITPILEQIADEFKGRLVVGKCNIDENREIPNQYNIRSIPTILFFKGGKVVDTVVGAQPKQRLIDEIKKNL